MERNGAGAAGQAAHPPRRPLGGKTYHTPHAPVRPDGGGWLLAGLAWGRRGGGRARHSPDPKRSDRTLGDGRLPVDRERRGRGPERGSGPGNFAVRRD